MNSYTYTAYGLHFASGFPLPELTAHANGKPDIIVNYGEVPETLPFASDNGLVWQSAPGKLLLTISDIGRYLIIENREIIIEPLPGIEEKDVRTFLLGSVLGALLHARQMLVLHSSVVRTKRGAVLFMGHSGAGKSTILGTFLQRGYGMIADDKAGIVVNNDGIVQVLPGLPFARLSRETVEEIAMPVQESQFNRELGKYVLPVENFCTEPLEVHAAYSLNIHNRDEIRLETLPPIEKFHVLNWHTYRRRFLHRTEQKQKHFEILGAMSKQAGVSRLFRPDNTKLIGELVNRIEEDLQL